MNRKHVLYLFLYILLGCMLASCNHPSDETVETQLAQAEAKMYAAPDSALQLLENLQPPKEKEQQATWALLLAQARYKNEIRQSDSLVNAAYSYFEKTDNAERKALALYLKGGISGENGDTDREQELYLKAKDEVQQTNDYRLGFLITSNLCNLYAYRGLKDYAFKALEEAHRYAQLWGDAEYIISYYIFLARIHSIKPANMEKAIRYYKEGIKLAKDNRSWTKLELMTWEYIGILCFTGNYEQALEVAHESIKLHIPDNLGPKHTLILGNIYRGLNKYDSAYYYLNKVIYESQSPRTKKGAYNYLYNLERERGHYKEALDACEKCLIYTDSIERNEKAQELIEMQAKYDQQKIMIQKNRLQIEKDRLTRNILILMVATILAIALVVGCYQRVLIKKERKLKQQEEAARQNALKLAENEMQMSRNKQRMAELAQQIEEGKDYKDQLEEQTAALAKMKEQNEKLANENKHLQEDMQLQTVHRQSDELNEMNRLTTENRLLHERETTLTSLLVAQNTFLSNIKDRHQYIKDEQWPLLKEELDRIFNGYTRRLLQQAPSLSESELHLACLIKLKMTNGEMAEALGISPSSVGKAKLRLKDRLAHSIAAFDKSMMLDVWLWEFH